MSQMQLLRLFISERLSVAAEEIFAAVQRTITECGQDSEQHGLKQEVHSRSQDTLQQKLGQEWSPESCHNDLSVAQQDCGPLVPDPLAIKQEQQEPWSPGRQQPPDMEESDTSTVKVTPTGMMSCIYSDVTELQTHDRGNEDRKFEPNTSADHRKAEGSSQSSSECWTLLPDCSITLNNMGPELSLETLIGYNLSKVHMQSHTGRNQLTGRNPETKRRDKSFCCRFCGKQFSHSAHLATHTRIHTGKKLFTCEVCGKEFRHAKSVTAHMRIHTEEKPYRCRICGKEFRHMGNLNVHMRTHTGEKPYSCTVCGKKFSRNNVMTKHMAVHTGDLTLSMKSVLRRGSAGITS